MEDIKTKTFLLLILCLFLFDCKNDTAFQSEFDWRTYPYLEITYASGISSAYSSSSEYNFWINIVIVNESNHKAYNVDYSLMMHDKIHNLVTLCTYTLIGAPSNSLGPKESINCSWEGYTSDNLPYSFDIILFFDGKNGNNYVNSLMNEPFKIYDYR